mmetsp:Transcript_46782/g.100161  ORF Transcript_46782/g.100161 Transcript_46782/m.100161 type:complete len:594 (+) Transcript_46782:35-1816(+)
MYIDQQQQQHTYTAGLPARATPLSFSPMNSPRKTSSRELMATHRAPHITTFPEGPLTASSPARREHLHSQGIAYWTSTRDDDNDEEDTNSNDEDDNDGDGDRLDDDESCSSSSSSSSRGCGCFASFGGQRRLATDEVQNGDDVVKHFFGKPMVCIDLSNEEHLLAALPPDSRISSGGNPKVLVVNMVSLRWLCHPIVFILWFWTLCCRFLESREDTFRLDTEGREDVMYCLYDSAGDIPAWWVVFWAAASVGDFPMWPGLIGTLPLYGLRVIECLDVVEWQGFAAGPFMPFVFFVIMILASFAAKPERRECFQAFAVIGCIATRIIIAWARWQGCLLAFMPNQKVFGVVRSMMPPLLELACRKSLGWCWQRWHSTVPHTIFMAAICTFAVNAQMLQMANFLHCAEYPDPTHAAARLSVSCIFFDVMSRTKTLQILFKACMGWPFVLDDAADLALRSRWLYIYALFPFVFAFALLTMNRVIVSVLFIYLLSELACDIIVLTMQFIEHRRRKSNLSLLEIWQRVRQPFGHIFLMGKDSRRNNEGLAKSTQLQAEVPMPPWFCNDAEAMVGLGLVIFPSNVIYKCLEGSFMRKVCY